MRFAVLPTGARWEDILAAPKSSRCPCDKSMWSGPKLSGRIRRPGGQRLKPGTSCRTWTQRVRPDM